MDDRDIGAGASAPAIENAYRIASQDVLDALLRAQLNPDDGPARYAFNAALVRQRELARLRRPSGVLMASARDAEELGAEALRAARQEFAGAWGRARFGCGQLRISFAFYRAATRAHAWAAAWHGWERIAMWLGRRRGR